MLTHLTIKNFAVVKQLELNLAQGFTAITGETGAGKSIAIDALQLCSGSRADAGLVRAGAEKADIIAHYTVSNNPEARAWLADNEMSSDDTGDTCFIRRVVSKEGRSKAFINGYPASLQQLKQLASCLLAIHGQNTHLALLKEDHQRQVLDNFAQHHGLLDAVSSKYRVWQEKKRLYQTLNEEKQLRADRIQLLSYQVKELNEFAIEEDEFAELETEHKRLSHHQHLMDETQQSLYALYDADQHAALSVMQQHTDTLAALLEHDESLGDTVSLLQESTAQLEEAVSELRHYTDGLDGDPERFAWVEARFSQAISLARKHSIEPENLYSLHQSLIAELSRLDGDEQQLDLIEAEVAAAEKDYRQAAEKLSNSRRKAAKGFCTAILDYIKAMNMPHAKLSMDVQYCPSGSPTAHGLDKIALLVAVNPGQPAGALDKVVSGGELSRIGLAVQVVSRTDNSMTTLVFDEVDTGISGPTASIVGQLLKRLSSEQQVMCVTHLPQVAAQAHNQLFVSKLADKSNTETRVLTLTPQGRVNELARLLAGDTVTDSAIENAKALLNQADLAAA